MNPLPNSTPKCPTRGRVGLRPRRARSPEAIHALGFAIAPQVCNVSVVRRDIFVATTNKTDKPRRGGIFVVPDPLISKLRRSDI